ncbi:MULTISPECIES: class I SAM-dependent methyltransferase [unclassified Rhizobium]|uniref:class I SAM-dependent methyltransferase n=1 Tax=unclassified Rhizobium TaxID=2613769 RepID=UPI000646F428|nr:MULTISPECIES: class I SAM-dependent methyltransferase [unclassified Rhizobium]OJY75899.1 MAG: hypothetical protein BGP09_19500 [Rhizobium sp. 60-20]RKD52375.1 methyltransferase family protein [Rhizobium sp. WW_1]
MGTDNYEALVAREQAIYNGERPSASIPSIFTYWASRYLSPRLIAMFGTPIIEQVFANEIIRISKAEGFKEIRIVSLGSGECSLEIDVTERLRTAGVKCRMICTDISPAMLEQGRKQVKQAQLLECFEFVKCDVNRNIPLSGHHFILANHCLHHFVELEAIFAWMKKSLHPRGALITSDMIGRNGHMRWPEAEKYVRRIWDTLPSEKKFDCINRVRNDQFVNFNCANGTFEGIRAQDIMPILINTLFFERFVGYGNLPDIFVDRMYGPNFSPDDSKDLALIDLLEDLNTDLIKAGVIKPTIMFATLRPHEVACEFDLISPDRAVRLPSLV